MKIRDIVLEAGIGQAVGQVAQGVGSVIGKAAGAAQMAHQGFKLGQDKMDKLLNPKRWFGKDKGDKSATGTRTPAAHETRRVLQQAAQGRPLYLQDKKDLKQLYQGVVNGDITANVDATALSRALKAAYTAQPLDKNQQQLLAQFSKQY